MEERYDPKKIEPKWQEEWERSNLNLTRDDRDRPKFYLLEMFPYPSGDGLSVGHLRSLARRAGWSGPASPEALRRFAVLILRAFIRRNGREGR